MADDMRVFCIMMQKNEDDLLRPWIKYHGALFSPADLIVIDNGSTSERVRAILDDAEREGVQVIRASASAETYETKHLVVGRLIQTLQTEHPTCVVLPLDCDEFVGVDVGGAIRFDRTSILAYLDTLRDCRTALAIKGSYFNIPGERRFFFWPEEKVFFCSGSFVWMDHGFHTGQTSEGAAPVATALIHVHCHYKPLALLKAHAREKLKARLDCDDDEAVRRYAGSGVHLIRYLSLSPEDYRNLFDPEAGVPLDGFGEALRAVGETLPFLP